MPSRLIWKNVEEDPALLGNGRHVDEVIETDTALGGVTGSATVMVTLRQTASALKSTAHTSMGYVPGLTLLSSLPLRIQSLLRLTPNGRKPVVNGRELPKGVEVFEIRGPFFFGAVYKFKETFDRVANPPKVLILNMRKVFTIDVTGLHAIETLIDRARDKSMVIMFSGLHPAISSEMERFGLIDELGRENVFKSVPLAVKRAREILGAEENTRTSLSASSAQAT